ncbi:MAG: carotenoid biosynthesis protein [Actinomycetes bacterium]
MKGEVLFDAAGPRVRHPGAFARRLPWALTGAVVAAEIAYPLVEGTTRSRLTVATVVLFFCASVTHAAAYHGVAWASGLVALAAGGGLAAEVAGSRTGYPFGEYTYTDALGWQVLDVPVVVPLAWAMMAYPALVVARRLTRRVVPLVGGLALASWDLFLDPQMVDAGHWRWVDVGAELPGVSGVPAQNFAGWLAVSIVLMALLHVLLPGGNGPEGVPATLYLWTYASSVAAAAVFFDRPGVALVGGVVMGLVAVPYAYRLWLDRP